MCELRLWRGNDAEGDWFCPNPLERDGFGRPGDENTVSGYGISPARSERRSIVSKPVRHGSSTYHKPDLGGCTLAFSQVQAGQCIHKSFGFMALE